MNFKPLLLAASLTLSAPIAHAAVFIFEAVVTSSTETVEPTPGVVLADYPSAGSPGTLYVEIFDNGNAPLPSPEQYASLGIFDFYTPSFFAAGVYGDLGGDVTAFEATETGFRFSSGSFTAFDPNETLYGGFSLSFATPAPATPTTYDELIAAMSDADDVGFSFNGSIQDEYVELAVRTVAAPAVPLPAGGLLLLTGLGALAVGRRR